MLQGHVETEYKRGIRKGEFELYFSRSGLYYRPWWMLRAAGKGYEMQNVRDFTGGQRSEFVAPPQSIVEDIRSKIILRGPADQRGFFDLSKKLCGEIDEVAAMKDPATRLMLSSPDAYSTRLSIKSKTDGNVKILGGHAKQDKFLKTRPGQRVIYYLAGQSPNDWKLVGPFDPEADPVDIDAAAKLKMDDGEVGFVMTAVRGDLPEQKSESPERLVSQSE